MSERSVAVSGESLIRAWRKGGRKEFWVSFTGDSIDRHAINHALAEVTDPEGLAGIVARAMSDSPTGHVAMLDGVDGEDQLLAWATTVADTLEAQGATGTIAGTKAAEYPRWITTAPAEPSAFITWNYGAPNFTESPTANYPLWKAGHDLTQTIAALSADFARSGGSRIVVKQGTFRFAVSDPHAIADLLAAAIRRDGVQAGVLCSDDRAQSARTAMICVPAQTVLQIIAGPDTWEQRIDELAEAMCTHPELVDYAFIRPAYRFVGGWSSLDEWVSLPTGTLGRFETNPHLTTSHVVDAHGVQLLTGTHLARIDDLTNWNVRNLGHDRYLVTAADLEPWYGNVAPDPETLKRARTDFANILLTQEAVNQRPAPWRGG